MTDYAVGQTFVKGSEGLIRIVTKARFKRYFATRAENGEITLPTLTGGDAYKPLQVASNATFRVNDNNREFRLFGDNGWADSVITGKAVQASFTAYFARNIDIQTGEPVFVEGYDEAFDTIQRSRGEEVEIYIELLKFMGQLGPSEYQYDFAGFNGCLMNYNDNGDASDLVTISVDCMSRGRGVFGYLISDELISYGDPITPPAPPAPPTP